MRENDVDRREVAVPRALARLWVARIVEWLSTPTYPEDAHLAPRLTTQLLDRRATLVISGLSTLTAATSTWLLTGAAWVVVWLVLDLVLSAIRIAAMEHSRLNPAIAQAKYVPILMGTGLVWSVMTGIVGALCMLDPNAVVSVLAVVLAAGHAGGISSRNAATPRYGLLLIFFTLAPLSVGAALCTYPGMDYTGMLIPIWAIGLIGIMNHNHNILVRMMRAEEATRQLALTDPLTGLHNRMYAETKLSGMCDELDTRHQSRFAVLMIDLDGFKQVNDTHGHRSGDLLLEAVSRRLARCVRDTDIVCRQGGDEFVVILPGSNGSAAESAAHRIIEQVSAPYELGGSAVVRIGASIGGALAPIHGTRPFALLEAADRALYAAKNTGKGAYLQHGATPLPALLSA